MVRISGQNTHGLTEAQAREIITKLRLGIGPDLDSLISRVGGLRVRNIKIICYLKIPSLEGKHQIGASRDNSLCNRGETCLETGTTKNLWESFGSG